MPTVVGKYPKLERIRSGIFSLDYALKDKDKLGIPLRVIYEIYGYTNSGKSTLSYYLSGIVGQYFNKDITICDLEMLDVDYLISATSQSGFDGEIRLVDHSDDKDKPYTHEHMLQDLAINVSKNNFGSGILDSVGAVMPLQEVAGDYGEANMGRRAKLIAQHVRDIGGALRVKKQPSIDIIINHVHAIMGGRGHTTAGGEAKTFLAGVRMMITPQEVFIDDKTEEPIGFLVKGKVEKLRFGGRGRWFNFYIVPGMGVHVGVSAMFDAFRYGVAERGARVKLGDRKIGYLKADLLKYAADGNTRKFNVFHEAMQEFEEENRFAIIEGKVEENAEPSESESE